MGRHGMRWEELRWDELGWSASVKCGVWGVKSAMWSVRKVFALYRGHTQVMFLDSKTATASYKARTHGPGWRTAHASSVVVLGSDSWKLRWHMRRDEMRRDELGWGEKSSDEMKGAVWSVKCGLWSVKRGVWSVKCEVCSGKREVWSVKSVKSAMRSVKCEMDLKSDMLNRTPLSKSARTHGLGWRTAHANFIDEKGFIYIFKVTSTLPRADITGNHIFGIYLILLDIS